MVLEAEPPFRLAVTIACPGAFGITGNSAKSAPAGILTCGGTEAIDGSLEVRAMGVTALGARETVTRSVPGVPLGSDSAAGSSRLTTGGGGVTSTVAAAEVSFTEAVMTALPGLTAVTGTSAEMAPAAMTTLSGAVATSGALFVSAIVVGTSCATLIVTVSWPVAPCWSGSGVGRSDTIAAACGETWTLETLEVPLADAVMVESPTSRPIAVKVALVMPCGTITEAGTCSTEGL